MAWNETINFKYKKAILARTCIILNENPYVLDFYTIWMLFGFEHI